MKLESILNLQDFESAAQRILPRSLYGFVRGAAEDGQSAEANRQAYASVRFVPRVLRDTSGRSTAVTLWDETWSAPFGIAPMGAAAAMALDADVAMARAAAEENVPFVLSGSSLTPMERVLAAHPRAWFQLYPSTQETSNLALLERARRAGFQTLVVTVDVPVGGHREDDIRNGYGSPLRPSWQLARQFASRPGWLARHLLPTLWRHGMPHFENFGEGRAPMISRTATRTHRRDNLDWNHIARLRDAWPGRLVLKGVLAPADARRAFALGADGVVLSNHGGRQLDGTIAPLAALPFVRPPTPHQRLLCDGGVRRGNDVLKALALGADLTFVGRLFMYAAVVAGHDGVRHGIRLLRDEIQRSMALLGITQPAQAAGCVQHSFQPIEQREQ
jgi:L-lactate dehydrogenase (cytochrome)